MRKIYFCCLFLFFGCDVTTKDELYSEIMKLKDENAKLQVKLGQKCNCSDEKKIVKSIDASVPEPTEEDQLPPEDPDADLREDVSPYADDVAPKKKVLADASVQKQKDDVYNWDSFSELRDHYRPEWENELESSFGRIVIVDGKKYQLISSKALHRGGGPCAFVESRKHKVKEWVEAGVTCQLLLKTTPKPDGKIFFVGQYILGWAPVKE